MKAYVTAFPDLRFDIDQMLASGEFVVTRWTASGIHAVRACYAALRMQDTVKRHAEVRRKGGLNVDVAYQTLRSH